MALCPASYQFMRRAAKGGSLKDQSFVIGAANDGGEPLSARSKLHRLVLVSLHLQPVTEDAVAEM